jgi:hypothetical protein
MGKIILLFFTINFCYGFNIFIVKDITMGKKFIITEEEKNEIKTLYNINEQGNTFVKKYTKFITYVDEDESVENEGNFVVKFSNGLVFLTNVGNSVVVKFAQMGGVSIGKLEGKDYQMIECKQSDGKDVVFLLFSDGKLRISLTSLIVKQLELKEIPDNPEENYVEFYK